MDLSAVKALSLAQGQRASGIIYEELRELILDGELPHGGVISQVALAHNLGVSRTPLREALRRLQQEGLIEQEPGRRARVVGFEADDLEIVYSSRMFFEPLALALTVPRYTDAEVDELERALLDMRAASDRNQYEAWEQAHQRFHDLLALHATDQLKRSIATLSRAGNRYRRIYQREISRRWNTGDAEHEAILLACRARREEEAAAQLARHLGRTAFTLMGRMAPEREPAEMRMALKLIASDSEGKERRLLN